VSQGWGLKARQIYVKGRTMEKDDHNITKNLMNIVIIFIGLIWGIYLIYISFFFEHTGWRRDILYVLGLSVIIVCVIVIFSLIKSKKNIEIKPRN
jgi:hypothetical protein